MKHIRPTPQKLGWQADGTYKPCPECRWTPPPPSGFGRNVVLPGVTHAKDCKARHWAVGQVMYLLGQCHSCGGMVTAFGHINISPEGEYRCPDCSAKNYSNERAQRKLV